MCCCYRLSVPQWYSMCCCYRLSVPQWYSMCCCYRLSVPQWYSPMCYCYQLSSMIFYLLLQVVCSSVIFSYVLLLQVVCSGWRAASTQAQQSVNVPETVVSTLPSGMRVATESIGTQTCTVSLQGFSCFSVRAKVLFIYYIYHDHITLLQLYYLNYLVVISVLLAEICWHRQQFWEGSEKGKTVLRLGFILFLL